MLPLDLFWGSFLSKAFSKAALAFTTCCLKSCLKVPLTIAFTLWAKT